MNPSHGRAIVGVGTDSALAREFEPAFGCKPTSAAEHQLKQTVGPTVLFTAKGLYYGHSSRPLLSFSFSGPASSSEPDDELEESRLTNAIFLAMLMMVPSQDSGATPNLSPEPPCHWSEDYVDWLSQFRASSDKRSTGMEHPKPPTKLRDAAPEYPQDARGRRNLGGRPVVEAVIDDSGKVLESRLIERIEWEPDWPEFDNAILAAVQKWEFEPVKVGSTGVWVCMTTSIDIHWGKDGLEKREDDELWGRIEQPGT